MAPVVSRNFEFPSGSVVVRFGVRTPFWPLSTFFGMFEDVSVRRVFVSLDHYIGFMLLRSPAHRQAIYETPNAFVANSQLRQILESQPDAMDPDWPERREEIFRHGFDLKFEQNLTAQRVLMRTGDRPIFDDSRNEDPWLCYARGAGENFHGRLLEEKRAELQKLLGRSKPQSTPKPAEKSEPAVLPAGTSVDWGDGGAKHAAEMESISKPRGAEG